MAFVAALRFRLEDFGAKKWAVPLEFRHAWRPAMTVPPRSKKAPRARGAYSWGSKTFEHFRRMHAFGMLLNKG